MSVTIRIPTQLRTLTNGTGEIAVQADDVRSALDALLQLHTGIEERLFDGSGQIRRFVNVFVGDEDVRFLSGLDTPVSAGETISIVPAVAGG